MTLTTAVGLFLFSFLAMTVLTTVSSVLLHARRRRQEEQQEG